MEVEKTITVDSPKVVQLHQLEDTTELLFVMETMFPFDFFPTKITIEKLKINFQEQIFFGSKIINTILISDISKIEVSTSFIFGSLKIYSITPAQKPLVASFLRAEAAVQAQRIIEGLMLAHKEKIDYKSVPKTELLQSVKKIGSSKL